LDKSEIFTEFFIRKSLLLTLATILLFAVFVTEVTQSQTSNVDAHIAFNKIAKRYIDQGIEQYNEGLLEQAEKSFLNAQMHEQYLSVTERAQLKELIEKIHERKRVNETYRLIVTLINQNKLADAKAHLERIMEFKSISNEEKTQILEAISKIDNRIKPEAPPAKQTTASTRQEELIDAEKSKGAGEQENLQEMNEQEIADLYYRSIGLYGTGQLEKAREGFVRISKSGRIPQKMAKTIDAYIGKIDESLGRKIPKITTASRDYVKPKTIRPKLVIPRLTSPYSAVEPQAPEPMASEGTYIDVVNRKRNIIQSHTRAVVNDTINKASNYVNEGEFDKATEIVASAEITVNKNQMYLEEALFEQCNNTLMQLREQIDEQQREQAKQEEQEKHTAAIEAQRQFRKQMEAEKAERIQSLMKNARAYQKQQRYEAALGALTSLLAIDPQNDEALLLKDTLEDTVYFKKQLDIKKESNKQRADILLKTDEAGVPYAKELSYPKNWKEIIAKPTRQPDEPIGLDPADVMTYEQLDSIVDLSALTPSMPLSDAVDIIKNSVSPPLRIVVLWRDLHDNAEIDQTTEINMDGLAAVRLGTGLDNLLKAVSGGFAELGYVVENGVITVATVESLPSKLETRVYDITDLLGEPADFRQIPYMEPLGYGGGTGGYGGGGYGGGGGGYGGGTTGGYGGGTTGGYGGGGYGGGGYGGGGSYGGGGYGGGGSYGGGGYGGGGGGYGGGYGGGGYGGGGGGYGGGGYGGGGYGGGGYGGGGYGGGSWMSALRAEDLVILIQDTIEPDSWYDIGTGEGTITPYPTQQPKKLIAMQTREIHKKIEKLLTDMRKALGYQVSIEARFLVVSENFLEDIGLDLDFQYNIGGKWGLLDFSQGSAISTQPDISTKVPGSLGGIAPAVAMTGGYGSILDDLQVAFILRATQGHTDAKTLTAPKVTVLSGESAVFQIQSQVSYALPPDVIRSVSRGYYAGGGLEALGIQQNVFFTPIGTVLNITPIITPDKKNVLLNIVTQMQDLLRMQTHTVAGIVGTAGGESQLVEYPVTVPETETSQVMTRVSVPDGGTLLLGGQKITVEVEKEAGVPVMSKIPIIGRLFSNRSKIKDQKILLILVKPTIILQEEREAEAIAALEGRL